MLGATSEDTSEYYEKGLLAPGVDYDTPPPYLRANCDVIDGDGYVSMPSGPGMGYDVQWDFIEITSSSRRHTKAGVVGGRDGGS